MADKVIDALRKATKDLLYPSETDAPFVILTWDAAENSVASLRRLAKRPPREKCVTKSLDDWLGDLLEEDAFINLKAALERHLANIQVYRFGGSDATYYIVGIDDAGRLVAMQTVAVET